MLRVLALLCLATNEVQAAQAEPGHGQLRALKSELQAEKRILSMVEKQRAQTEGKLKEKLAKKEKLDQQVQRMQQLNDQLIRAEKEKEEIVREVKSLDASSINQSAVLLSLDRSLGEELKTESTRTQQQSAEMDSLSAQEQHFRSEIRQLKERVRSAEAEVEKSRRQAGPLIKAESQEGHTTAMLQEKLKTRTGNSRAARAKDMAQREQQRMLSKQGELARMNFAIGNSSILLEKEKGELEAERLHAEDITKEASRLTDQLATKEDQLKSSHRSLGSLSGELARKQHETESVHEAAATLKDFVDKDASVGSQKVTALMQQLHTKEAKVDALQKEVTKGETEVKDVMSKIKASLNQSKEMLNKTSKLVLLQESESKANSTAVADLIKAAEKENQDEQRALDIKLKEVQAEEAEQESLELKEYQQKHNTASAQAQRSFALARLRAQKHQMEQQSKKYGTIRSRLTSEISSLKTGAKEYIRRAATELNALHNAISKVRAGETVKVAKVNKQMSALMRSAKELKATFLNTDAEVDRLIKAEAVTAQRMQKMKLEVTEKATAYDVAKRRVEGIYEQLRAGGSVSEAAEVQRLSHQLQEAKVHQEHAVSLLSAKLKDVHQQLAAVQQSSQVNSLDSVDAARESLEHLQDEFDTLDAERPDLDIADDSVRAVLKEVEGTPSFLQVKENGTGLGRHLRTQV